MMSAASLTVLLCAFYFACLSGGVYDALVWPPFMGEPSSTNARRLTFHPNRLEKQYVLEGFVAGVFLVAGTIGFLLLAAGPGQGGGSSTSTRAGAGREARRRSKLAATMRLGGGLICVVVALNALVVFMRYKQPAYLRMGHLWRSLTGGAPGQNT